MGFLRGSALGPRLFSIFIIDAPSTIGSEVAFYAEDLKLTGPTLSSEDHALLQNNLGLLDHWAEAWVIKFNFVKCHIIHFGKINLCCSYFPQFAQFSL